MPPLSDIAGRLGRRARRRAAETLYAAGYMATVFRHTARFFRRRQAGMRVLVMQILFTGVEALGIISVLALGLGAVIIVQGNALLPQFGQGQLMYQLLVVIVTRELGPLLTAFVIIARSGTAIATEIAGMVVSHEVEAFMAHGIDPISYMVVPRFVGVVVSLVLLNVYFSLMGLFGAYLLANLVAPIPIAEYGSRLIDALGVADIVVSLSKALVFGTVISLMATYAGFSANRASTEVPQAGLKAVGGCFVWCIVADGVVTVLFYLLA